MALPVLPSYTPSNLIEAAGIFLPLFQGGVKPSLARMLHAETVLQIYAIQNFAPDVAASSDAALAESSLMAIAAGNHGNLSAVDWKSLLLTILEEIIKLLLGSGA